MNPYKAPESNLNEKKYKNNMILIGIVIMFMPYALLGIANLLFIYHVYIILTAIILYIVGAGIYMRGLFKRFKYLQQKLNLK